MKDNYTLTTANSTDNTENSITITPMTSSTITISYASISNSTSVYTYYVKPRKNVVLHISPNIFYDEGDIAYSVGDAPNLEFQLI